MATAFLLQLVIPQSSAAVSSIVDNANRDATRIQQENSQRQKNLEQELRKDKTLQPKPLRPLPPPPKEEQEDNRCMQIDRIELEGITQLHFATIDKLLAPYEGRCLSLNRINRLLHDITNAYFTRGYVTTRAYLKDQSLAEGSLLITVIEGQVESIEFIEPQESTFNLPLIFPGSIGGILNLRELEQGLDNLNRLQSNNVQLDLAPGSQPGRSRVQLKNKPSNRIHFNIGTDNSGQESTGEVQGHAGLGLDNPFGLADYFSLLYSRELDQQSSRENRSVSGTYEFPFGMNRLQLSVSGFRYKSRIEGTGQSFSSSGTSSQLKAKLERTLYRNQNSKTLMALALDRKEEDNFLEDVKLDASSRTLAAARLSINHQLQFKQGSMNTGLTVHRGLNGFGADEDSSLSPSTPRAQFDKLTADLNVYLEISAKSLSLSYNLNGHAQYTNDLLFGTERLALGGLYSIRGYKNDNISGDRGGFVRNELTANFRAPRRMTPYISSVRPYVAFDLGSVEALDRPDLGYQRLRGWAIGINASGRHLGCQLGFAKAIDNPAYIQAEKHEIYFSLTFRS